MTMEYRGVSSVCLPGRGGPVAVTSGGTMTRAGAVRSDLVVQLENTAFALLVGTILLGVPALMRLLGLG